MLVYRSVPPRPLTGGVREGFEKGGPGPKNEQIISLASWVGNTPKQSFLSLWFFSFWGPACVQVLCWFVTILKRPYDPRIPREHFISSKKLQISKMCASLIIGKSALEIFRSKIKLRCHFKQPIKRNGFLSSGHPNMITKIKQEKRNLFLSFFSTNVFF